MKKSLAPAHPQNKRVIAIHLVFTLYGHWAVNDPRGSGSSRFHDLKFEPLGEIHFGRRPPNEQPTRQELKLFHKEHQQLLNFPIFWIDPATRLQIADTIRQLIKEQGYTCAICGNHLHLVIRTHKHDSLTIWNHFAEAIRTRLRLRFPEKIAPHHPAISARPYKVFLYLPGEVWDRIDYVDQNPLKENLPRQDWDFVIPYDNFPFHKQPAEQADARRRLEAKARLD